MSAKVYMNESPAGIAMQKQLDELVEGLPAIANAVTEASKDKSMEKLRDAVLALHIYGLDILSTACTVNGYCISNLEHKNWQVAGVKPEK